MTTTKLLDLDGLKKYNEKIKAYADSKASSAASGVAITATTSGSGNAVTSVTASGKTITVTKGTTFLTSHQDISGKADKNIISANNTYTSSNTVESAINAVVTSVDELYNLVYNILWQDCTMFVVVYASDTSALQINGTWVSIPAGKPTILKDVKTLSVNPDSAGTDQDPARITRFDIHCNGKFQITHWKMGAYMNQQIGLSKITSLDVSSFDTSKVTDMWGAFFYCRSLTTLDVSSFNTQNVTDMGYMFANCRSLTTLDVSSFDTSKVTNMDFMFFCCASLTTLDVSSFDTSKVTNMGGMFYLCSFLTTLDVSSFDTSKVTNMGFMFYSCYVLTNLIFGSKWGTQTSTAANALTLDLSSIGSSKSYKLTDETYNSMLTMYDRKTAGLTEMTIKLSKSHNIPDGWTDKMVARGYTIVLV